MKITACRPSPDPCTESGWTAYDYRTSAPLDDAFITSLRPLGNLMYLRSLKKPFFKIESDRFFIKGLRDTNTFRVAIAGDDSAELDRILAFIEQV
jgi:hypothetical protein